MPGLQHLLVLLAFVVCVRGAPAAEHVAPIHELGAVEEPATSIREKKQNHHANQVYHEEKIVQQYPMVVLPVQWHQQFGMAVPVQWHQEPVRVYPPQEVHFKPAQPQWQMQHNNVPKTQQAFGPALRPKVEAPKHPEANTVTPQKPTTTTTPQPKTTTKQEVAFTEASPALTNVQGLRPIIERGLLELCLGLDKASNGPDSTENTILAPLSVAAMAALLLAGARGQTQKELEHLFGIDHVPHKQDEVHRTLSLVFSELESTQSTSGQTIAWGSGIFMQKGEPLAPDYIRLARDVYRSEIVPVDFRRQSQETAATINRWVANRTEGHIQTLLEDSADPSTSIIIANVFFFRATWEQPFIEKFTKVQNFHVSRKETLRVPMMVGMMTVPYAAVRDSHAVVGLPYKGGESVMYFVLPKREPRKFIMELTPEKLRDYINQTTVQPVIVAVPRMRVEGSLELSGPLTSLGAGSMFRPGVADLSGIHGRRQGSNGQEYHVDEMLHKVSLEVTETGTVGAAATATSILRDGSTPVFRADSPFLFFVYHRKTGSVLFWGTVFRPQLLGDGTARKP